MSDSLAGDIFVLGVNPFHSYAEADPGSTKNPPAHVVLHQILQ